MCFGSYLSLEAFRLLCLIGGMLRCLCEKEGCTVGQIENEVRKIHTFCREERYFYQDRVDEYLKGVKKGDE